MRRLRVLHVPDCVGGHPPMLAAAERELGLDSRCVAFDPSPFGYPVDEVLRRPGEGRVRFEMRRLELLLRAAVRFDVVHFNFGSTILPLPPRGPDATWRYRAYARVAAGFDVKLLRRLGKGIVVTFQGDDVRQGDVLRRTYGYSLADEVAAEYYTGSGDAAKRWITRLFDRNAHAIRYLNPDLARVLPPRARFQPYAHVDARAWIPTAKDSTHLCVAHAPSRRDTKGTRHVLAAVEALRHEGLQFRFELIEGVSQVQARAAYERADLVVDQLVAGWYGGVAVEAMALAVPVVAHIRQRDLGVIPTAMRTELPVVDATPGTIRDVLRSLVTTRRDELPSLGMRARRFVQRWHDPSTIAAELQPVYEEAAASSAAK